MIQTNAQLSDFLCQIKHETKLAIDTEFRWVDTYYPKLCLIQIASTTMAECIDVLAIKNLAPLYNKLYQQDVLWIAHASRNDIGVLYHYSKRLPNQVFDTQISVDLLKNLYPENFNSNTQISYQALTKILQGVTLEKTFTNSNWTIRPLPEEAIKYALDDVRYLIKNYYKLKAQLEDEQKFNWIIEEGQSLLNVDLYKVNFKQSWRRIKGFSRLPKKLHNFAAQLSAWRESCAIDKNKPRKWILSDSDLINLALGKNNLNHQKQQKFDDFLIQYPELQTLEINVNKHTSLMLSEKTQKLILQKIIQEKANQYNLTTEIIASNKTLLRYIRGDQSVGFLKGWRFNILKEELEKCKIV